MTNDNAERTDRTNSQRTTGDRSTLDALRSPGRRDVLKAIGASAALGVLGSGSAGAAGASFGDGVNLQPSYFCSGDQDLGWDLMNEYPDIETVRIEIEPFSFDEVVTTVEDAKRWIDEANANGKDVIATYHHYPDNGSPDASALQNAAEFWAEHYEALSQDSTFTINMMNEWGDHDVSASEYASAYNSAIDTVRSETSYDDSIVVDAPGWGQGTYRLADAVEMIDEDDLILSAHVYPVAYNATTGQSLVAEDLDAMDETGYPCMIGEFGSNMDGDADWSAIVDHAKELGWPVIGWAWNGDGSNEPMNMANPYWGNDCSADSYTASSYFDIVYDKLGSGDGSGGNGGDDGSGDDGSGDDGSGNDGSGDDGNDDVFAELDPSTTSAGVGDRITFQVVDTTGNDHWLTSLEWEFGDGTTATGWWNAHSYDAAGSYTVALTATNEADESTTDEVTITVS